MLHREKKFGLELKWYKTFLGIVWSNKSRIDKLARSNGTRIFLALWQSARFNLSFTLMKIIWITKRIVDNQMSANSEPTKT